MAWYKEPRRHSEAAKKGRRRWRTKYQQKSYEKYLEKAYSGKYSIRPNKRKIAKLLTL